MKTKNYRHGKHLYKTYMKPVGRGFEVGFVFGGKPLFIGNFIHSKEANTWWTTMNTEISKFSKKYWVTSKAPTTFYTKFMTNHLYKAYYKFLDKCFTKYNRTYTKQFSEHERKYQKMKKNWRPTEKTPLKRAV